MAASTALAARPAPGRRARRPALHRLLRRRGPLRARRSAPDGCFEPANRHGLGREAHSSACRWVALRYAAAPSWAADARPRRSRAGRPGACARWPPDLARRADLPGGAVQRSRPARALPGSRCLRSGGRGPAASRARTRRGHGDVPRRARCACASSAAASRRRPPSARDGSHGGHRRVREALGRTVRRGRRSGRRALHRVAGFDRRLWPLRSRGQRAWAGPWPGRACSTPSERDAIVQGAGARSRRARRRDVPVPARARGHPHEHRAAARRARSGPPAASSTPAAHATTRSRSTSGSTSGTRARVDGGLRDTQAALVERAAGTWTRPCRATRICSAPSPSCSATTCSPTSSCSQRDRERFRDCAPAPTSCRWAAAPWPAPPSPSTARRSPATSASPPSAPTAWTP